MVAMLNKILLGTIFGISALLASQSSLGAPLEECMQSNFSDRVQIEVTAPDSFRDFEFVATFIQLPGGALLATNFGPHDQNSHTQYEWASELNGSTAAKLSIEVQSRAGRMTQDYEIEFLCEDNKLKLDLNLFVRAVKVQADLSLFSNPKELAAIKVQHDESISKLVIHKKNLQLVLPMLSTDKPKSQISLTLTPMSALGGDLDSRMVTLNLEESLIFQLDGGLNVAPIK